MKKLCLGLFVSCLFAAAVADNPVLRIMPLGDSITEGAGAGSTGGYRGPLWTKLVTEDHYNVDYVGSNTTNPDTTNGMDRDHEGHGGWRIDTTSGGNGIFEMLPTWFSSIESPDVILLHIGTNDSGADTLNTMTRTTALLDRLFAMQPSAHVFVSTLMWRNDATRYARIQTYNSNLTNVVAAQVAKGQKISIVDMHAAVPGGEEFGTVNFGDGLHPNTTGYALMANAWLGAIQQLYPDPADFVTTNAPAVVTATPDIASRTKITLRLNTAVTQASAENLSNYSYTAGAIASAALNVSGDSRTVTLTLATPAEFGGGTLTVSGLVNAAGSASSSAQTFSFVFPHPQGAENYVPASELAQYKLAYSYDPPAAGANCIDATFYAVDNHMEFGSIARVAYYVELRKPNEDLQYVWVSMDAFTNDAAFVGVPVRARGATFQQYVQNLKVWSNASGVQTGERGQGFIEFWPNTYNGANVKNVPGATGNYDFGDQMTSGNYGCMQVHDVAAKQTVFAFNHWAVPDTVNPPTQKTQLGFGNSNLRADATDWTFADNGDKYDVRRIQVYVLPDTADRTPPSVVSAEYGFSRQKITVTFSEPVAEANLTSCFTVNGGAVAIRSARRSTADARVAYVLCDVLPDGPVTLTVEGVRDQSPHVNAIARTTVAAVDRGLPSDISSKVNASLTAGFQVVYAFDIPQKGRFINNPDAFFIDESMGTNAFSRVAYFAEYTLPNAPTSVKYVWVATDAFTERIPQIGIPFSTTGAWFQQKLRNTDVASNVSGLQTGTGLETCNIEFWPTDYGQAGKLGLGGNNGAFDFDDTKNAGGSYGSMQIHNYGAKQTLFGMNRWGSNNGFIGFGISNRVGQANTDWTHADNAGTYATRRIYVLAKEGPPPTTFAEAPADVVARVPDAAGYELVLDYDLPVKGWMNDPTSNLSYRVTDNTAKIGNDFARVAYFFELVANNSTTTQYVWTAFDAFTQDATRLVVPTNFTYQQKIANLDVESNVSGITTGKGIATGNIEFHSNNYSKGNKIGIPGADANLYDFGDQMDSVGGVGYGCVQVHNYGARQTLFAINNFNKGATLCVGIGNDTRSDGSDWTFNTNAGNYKRRRLRVFVSRAKRLEPLPINDVGLPRRAIVSAARDKVCVSFPSAVPQDLQKAERYAFADPSVRIADVSPSAGEPRDVLLTLAQPLEVDTTNALVVSLAPYAADVTLTVVARDGAVPAFLTNAVPELAGYRLLNELKVTDRVCYSHPGADYLVDESRFDGGMRFDRVAYCMELQDTNSWRWTCAAMDTFCEDASKLGVPSVERQINHQCYVTNLSVYAGASAGALPVHTGNYATGNLEFWPNNYGAANPRNVPGASASDYDFGDSMPDAKLANGHGSMQVHNYLERETILSLVAFGHNGAGKELNTRIPGLGVGNNPNSTAKKDPDWTFQEGNAVNYSVKNIYVFVRPLATGAASLGNGPEILVQPDASTKRLLGTGDIVLSVYAPDAVSYQWRKDGVPIPNATGRELVITDKVESHGTYDVVAYIDNANYTVSQSARATVFHRGSVIRVR